MQEIGDGSFKDENRMSQKIIKQHCCLKLGTIKCIMDFFFILKQINKQNAFPAIKS